MNKRVPKGLPFGPPIVASIELSGVTTAATKEAWWIKVCESKSSPFRIDYGPSGDNISHHFHWSPGAPTEFDLPEDWNKVFVIGYVDTHPSPVYFGVCYGTQVTSKHYDFDDYEGHDIRRGDTDEWDCN